MRGHSNMQSAMYRIEIGMMDNQSILWVFAFSVLVASPSPIFHILLRSDGLTSKCLSLEVKVLWEGTPWCWPSKKSLLRSVIPVVSTTLALDILTCDTSLVATKYGMCTVSCRPVSISVLWTLLRNESAQIYAIPADKYSSSSLCETFGKWTEWVSKSCGDVRTIHCQYSNCCCVGDKVSKQKNVPEI